MEMRMSTTSAVSFNQAISTSGANTNATLNASGVVTAAPTLTASIVGADLANDIYRSTVTAYPSGGVAPYTYSWIKVSGQLNITGTTTASSVATTTNLYCAVYIARLQVVITDSVGNQVTRQGDAAIQRNAPPGKPADFCNSLTTPPPVETSMHYEPPAVQYAMARRAGS